MTLRDRRNEQGDSASVSSDQRPRGFSTPLRMAARLAVLALVAVRRPNELAA